MLRLKLPTAVHARRAAEFAGGVVGQVHLGSQQKLLEQVRGDVRLDDCAEGGVAVTLRIPKVVSRRMAA